MIYMIFFEYSAHSRNIFLFLIYTLIDLPIMVGGLNVTRHLDNITLITVGWTPADNGGDSSNPILYSIWIEQDG